MRPPAKGPSAAARVDEGLLATIGGVRQWITIRGEDRANPVLLVLAGPGAAFSRLAPVFASWERDFVVVQWDQPGSGLTLGKLVSAAAEVIAFVCARFGAKKAVVLGLSGGSVVGLMLARRRPDLCSAYVGSGQFVHYARQDALSYAAALAKARAAGDVEAARELERLGPPPWPDAASDAVVSQHSGALTPAEQAAFTPDLQAALRNPPTDATYLAPGVSEASPRARAMGAYESLRDELKAFDARRLGRRFEVPILFIQGEEDLYSVTAEVEAYAAEIAAPRKALSLIPGGGHSCYLLGEAFLAPLRAFVGAGV